MKFTPSKKCSLDQLGAIQLIILCSCFLVWYFVTSSRQKIISLLFSGIYSIIEYNFYRHTNDRPDGSFEIKWFGKPGFTTVEQFLMNLLYMPLLTDGFRWLVSSPLLRILLSPFNIWTLEIVEGSFLILLYGYNPAWYYGDKPDGYLNGLIKKGHWTLWVILGILMEIAYFLNYNPTNKNY